MLTTPLLEALARRHGPVDVVTTPAAATLVETHPAVRRVIPYDKRGKDRGLGRLVALARTLRAERYAVAYLPHRSLRTATLAWLARIPKRVGFRDGWPMLYTEVRQRARTDHEIDRLLALAGPAGPTRTGGAMTPATPRLETTREDRRAANEFLGEHGIGEPFAALAPGSIWGSKRWPYYAELAERLAARVAIVVVGGPEDVGLADEVLKAVEGGERVRPAHPAPVGGGHPARRRAGDQRQRAAALRAGGRHADGGDLRLHRPGVRVRAARTA